MHDEPNAGDGTPSGTPDDRSGADQVPVSITTNRRHLHTLRSNVLRDLEELLEGAVSMVNDLHTAEPDWREGIRHVRAHDARSRMAWIVEAVETLDDLGWASEADWTGYRA